MFSTMISVCQRECLARQINLPTVFRELPIYDTDGLQRDWPFFS